MKISGELHANCDYGLALGRTLFDIYIYTYRQVRRKIKRC